MDIETLTVEAFAQLGIEARLSVGAPDDGVDLVLAPDSVKVPIQLKHRALVTEYVAERLLDVALPPDTTLLVVADRVTDTGRAVLLRQRGGFLDLRGRLALRTERLVVDAEVEPVKGRASRSTALSGKAGMEVATAVLMNPERAVAVRELARELGRSPSTVSEVLAALRRDDLLDAGNGLAGTDLFWQVTDAWTSPRVHLAKLPLPGDAGLQQPLRFGLDLAEHELGWALTDSAAAAAYGAPLAFRSGQLLDFFVPDQSIIRRAATLLGTVASATQAQATLRVSPVPAAVRNRIDSGSSQFQWPLAHPLFVALDLAQDVGRGREVLDAWTPDDRWTRVW